MTSLSLLAVLLGLGFGAPAVYGLAQPIRFTPLLRNFHRSMAGGVVLMLAATAWFLWNLSQESIADFAAYKWLLYLLFAGVGIGSCIFVRDFLAVRGLAVFLLLLAKAMVDTGRPFLAKTSWVLVIQTLAYVFVILGFWLTISPWRLRDWLNWASAQPERLKIVCISSLGLGLLAFAVGWATF